jgi:hypothetical protein
VVHFRLLLAAKSAAEATAAALLLSSLPAVCLAVPERVAVVLHLAAPLQDVPLVLLLLLVPAQQLLQVRLLMLQMLLA